MFNKNKFIIKEVIKNKTFITYKYDVEGPFKKFFWLGEMFNINYENINIEDVPNSVAVIPLVANVLPLIWLNNGLLVIDELDKDFYNCIGVIKESYKKMLPMCKFKGKIKVKKIVENKRNKKEKTACFFTGGIDSYATLINVKKENPYLITVWGADIDYDNIDGFNNVRKYVKNVGKQERSKNIIIRAAVRRFIDNTELENTYHNVFNDNWWHAIQHSLGFITLAAPLSFIYNYKKIFFASTYTEADRKERHLVCASLPEIDNNISFYGTKVIHEGFQNDRMQKVKIICDYSKKEKRNIPLHVCYKSKNGDNCCSCEKCYRTITAILSEGEDPNRYGFVYDEDLKEKMINYMLNESIDDNVKTLWKQIIENLKNKKSLNKYQKDALFICSEEFLNNMNN